MKRNVNISNLRGDNVVLIGVGHYFPEEAINNKFLEDTYGFNDEWIVKNTGVSYRHWPDSDKERHVDLAIKAAEMAMEDANIKPMDVDILICTSSTTRPSINPSTRYNNYMDIAPPLQSALGAKKAFVFDISAVACLGFLNSTLLAQALLNSLNLETAMVVCAENPKPILNFKFKNSALFGAGAAATIWRRSEDKNKVGLIDVLLHSDGDYFNAFDIDENNKMIMKGKLVGEVARKVLNDVSRELLDRNNLTVCDIDWFIPHQANINIIDDVMDDLGVKKDRVLLNIHQRGNTSSVGSPSCLSEYVNKKVIKPGDLIFTCSIGRGFSWGAALFKYKY